MQKRTCSNSKIHKLQIHTTYAFFHIIFVSPCNSIELERADEINTQNTTMTASKEKKIHRRKYSQH